MQEAELREYDLYCFQQQDSDRISALYCGTGADMPERIQAYRIPLTDVEVRSPVELRMPLAIDFGSAGTTAGICLEPRYLEETREFPLQKALRRTRSAMSRLPAGAV